MMPFIPCLAHPVAVDVRPATPATHPSGTAARRRCGSQAESQGHKEGTAEPAQNVAERDEQHYWHEQHAQRQSDRGRDQSCCPPSHQPTTFRLTLQRTLRHKDATALSSLGLHAKLLVHLPDGPLHRQRRRRHNIDDGYPASRPEEGSMMLSASAPIRFAFEGPGGRLPPPRLLPVGPVKQIPHRAFIGALPTVATAAKAKMAGAAPAAPRALPTPPAIP
jgi:hypothetical protein